MSDNVSNYQRHDSNTRHRGHHRHHLKHYKSSKHHHDDSTDSSNENDSHEVAIDVGEHQSDNTAQQRHGSRPGRSLNDYEIYMNRVRDTPDGDCFNWTGLCLIVFLVFIVATFVFFRDHADHTNSLGEHHDLDDVHNMLGNTDSSGTNT